MTKLEHHSLPEAVRRTLRQRILNAEIPEGARLVEMQLADEFAVSRTTIRQALRELQTEGLVMLAPRRHCVVTRMDQATAEEVLFARYSIELAQAFEWVRRGAPGLVEELEAAVERMRLAEADKDTLAAVEADTAFHGLIVSAGGHRRLEELWHNLDGQMGALMRSSLDRQHAELPDVTSKHVGLLEAFRTRKRRPIEEALKQHYMG